MVVRVVAMSEAVRHLWWRLTAHSDSSEVVAYPPSWLFYTSNVLEDLIFNFLGTVKCLLPLWEEPLHLFPVGEVDLGGVFEKKLKNFLRSKKSRLLTTEQTA